MRPTINLTRTDQSVGDSVVVSNFQNVDASALGAGQGVSIIGSAGANVLTGGAGADTINGGGGADVVSAGAGDDNVSYWATEVSIDGGAGNNTLLLRAAAVVNLANADQTTGDSTSVANFQNVDGSLLTTSSTITGSAAANIITGGAGNDTIDGAGGADIIAAGTGNDTVFVHGNEVSIDGGEGNDTLVLPASSSVTTVNFAVAAGLDQTAGDTAMVANFESLDAGAMATALTVTGSLLANTITTGSGNDIIHGGGGGDIIRAGAGNDAVDYWGTEVSIERRKWRQHAGAAHIGDRRSRRGGSNGGQFKRHFEFRQRRRERGFDRRLGSGHGGREHYYRRRRRGYHRRRWRRRYHQCRCRQ